MELAEYLKAPYGRVVVPESDGTFRAEITEFPGCIAVGDTAAEALANLEDVAISWLEATLAKGQHVPEPIDSSGFSGKLVLRLAKSLHKRAAYAAKHDAVSLNHFIVNCIAEQVGMRSVPTMIYPQPLQVSAQINFQVGLNNLMVVSAEYGRSNRQVATSAGQQLISVDPRTQREDNYA
jgi:antitoxin HicB